MKIVYQKIGFILIHDLSGSNKDLLPLAKKLSMLGYLVSCPNLSSHKAKYNDWMNDIENSYNQLKVSCAEIVLIGYEGGGLLSLQIASRLKVKGIITINTLFFGDGIYRLIIKELIHFRFKQLISILKEVPIRNYKRLLNKTRKILTNIRCDLFINQVTEREIECANYLQERVQSKIKNILVYNDSTSLNLQNEGTCNFTIDLVKYLDCLYF